MPRTRCARTCSSARRDTLKVDVAKLQIRDGVISSTEDPKKKVTFVELVKANKGTHQMHGRGLHPGRHRQGDEPRRGRVLCRGRSGHMDGRLALRAMRLLRMTPGTS